MEDARRTLERELDIIDLVKSKRYLHLALRHLLQPDVRKQLKEKS